MVKSSKAALALLVVGSVAYTGAANAKLMAAQACLNEIVNTWGGDNGCNSYGNSTGSTVICSDGAVGQVYQLSWSHGAWHCNASAVVSLD